MLFPCRLSFFLCFGFSIYSSPGRSRSPSLIILFSLTLVLYSSGSGFSIILFPFFIFRIERKEQVLLLISNQNIFTKNPSNPMNLIQLATPSHFPSTGQIERVGLHRNQLFVALRNSKQLEIWTVHCLVPSSWTRLFSYQFHELFYAHCVFSPAQNAVFTMVAAFFETGSEVEDGGIKILRYDMASNELPVFDLDPGEVDNFEEVTLERVGIGCGESEEQLFLIDRSMVTGKIPFWHISLNWHTMTFSIRSRPITDDQQLCAHCVRFPVVLDGDHRIVLRITEDYQVAVYDGNSERWEVLSPDQHAELDLSSISVRGISETFGHNWHRFSAIESKMSVIADGSICVFKVMQNGKHHFYTFNLSLEKKSYNLVHCSCVKLPKLLETLCHVHCAESRIAFFNKHLVGVVFTQPPSLREISFWIVQRQFARRCPRRNVWEGGKTIEEMKQMFRISPGIRIVD